jgi:hypothetical protein
MAAAEPTEGRPSLRKHVPRTATPYHLTPERLPTPPFSPDEALAAARCWTYPLSLEGSVRTAVVVSLAEAVVVASRQPKNPSQTCHKLVSIAS